MPNPAVDLDDDGAAKDKVCSRTSSDGDLDAELYASAVNPCIILRREREHGGRDEERQRELGLQLRAAALKSSMQSEVKRFHSPTVCTLQPER